MSIASSEVITTLTRLIETCKDGQEGFRLAAEAITGDEDLKAFLFSCSLQRSTFSGELQSELVSLGHSDAPQASTVASALHRGWINLRTVLSGNDNHAVLAECERGEDSAVAEYRKAINERHLSGPIDDIVQRQFQEVLATHNAVRGLRDELAAEKTPLRETAAAKFQALRSNAADGWTGARQKTDDLLQSTEIYVRENPFPAILTALGIGFGLGLLVRSLERPSRDHIEVPIPRSVQKVRDFDFKAAVLPFLWPIAKFFSTNYATARKGAKTAYDQARDIDVNKYVDPVVKRAKKFF